ncbi:MAG: hypothetical protein RL318_1104 [Fibrobacterota bacterium]|jgi:acetylornithine deacetylase/succinyl-diaminopimelate desuccinylase-like protein
MDASQISGLFQRCDELFPSVQSRLADLVRIPSISFPGFDAAEVLKSARACAAWFREIGIPDVQVGGEDTSWPYVIARDHRAGPGAPTVLLYAHHDVQPPLRTEVWKTPAFEPVVVDGRMHGRGSADDKAGVALHAGSIQAWYAHAGTLPVNVTLLIEGEEETGSDHLHEILTKHKDELRSDLLVIADLANHDTGIPSLTTSLRGIAALEVELSAQSKPLHSGLWGGAARDPAFGLCQILSSLFDARGGIAVEGLLDGVEEVTPQRLQELGRIPMDLDRFRQMAGMPCDALLPDQAQLLADLWLRPCLVVNAVQCGVKGQTGNVVMDRAWARVSLRTVAGMDATRCLNLLEAHLLARVPEGMALEVRRDGAAKAWSCREDLPVLDLARKALEEGYGRDAVTIGCGATIPFVESMTAALGGIPALLVGVEDPWCNAHAENESVDLGDLARAIRSQARLFSLLSEAEGGLEQG